MSVVETLAHRARLQGSRSTTPQTVRADHLHPHDAGQRGPRRMWLRRRRRMGYGVPIVIDARDAARPWAVQITGTVNWNGTIGDRTCGPSSGWPTNCLHVMTCSTRAT